MYTLVSNQCNCHPETCCCDDYKIKLNEKVICGGSFNLDLMEKLVEDANKGISINKDSVESNDADIATEIATRLFEAFISGKGVGVGDWLANKIHGIRLDAAEKERDECLEGFTIKP